MSASVPVVAAALLAVSLLSAAGTAAAIGYARRRNLFDQPGKRRSHTQPTPRGGGIGIVVAALAVYAAEFVLLPPEARFDLAACVAAVVLVALVGWIDDHGGLAARWRLLAHCVAAALVLAPSALDLHETLAGNGVAVAAVAVAVGLALVWSINLHNFMDGINGLLAFQALFVFAAFAWLAASTGADADGWHLAALAAAVAAFVPFNFPQARVFMGDVGSGTLGLLIGIAALRLLSVAEVNPFSAPVAMSAFVIDATCNLASRMIRGRRWYSAHREHLYQWLARSGRSHAAVVAGYAGWNLLVVAPVLVWLQRDANRPGAAAHGALAAALVYAAGTIVWICGKRWSLRNVRSRKKHPRMRHATA